MAGVNIDVKVQASVTYDVTVHVVRCNTSCSNNVITHYGTVNVARMHDATVGYENIILLRSILQHVIKHEYVYRCTSRL